MESEKYKKGTCCICHNYGQCGMKLLVEDGEIKKVEGDLEDKISKGILCPRGSAIRQYIYSEDRIKYPLKRVGPRDSNKFERISWEEAYKIIGENLNKIKDENGAESLAFYAGYPKWYRPMLARMTYTFGSPNFINESGTCSTATDMAWKLVFGTSLRPDIKNSNLILVWSRNIAYTGITGIEAIEDKIDDGVSLIVVDPRITPLTQKADLHLRVFPGTDGALALGMAKVILEENLEDKEFVEKYVQGLEEFKEYLSTIDLEDIEKITRVKVEDIIKAARLYGSIKPASIMTSAAPVVHHVNGVQNSRALMSLVALTGNFDIKGGNIALVENYRTDRELLELNNNKLYSREDIETLGMGELEFPIWRELVKSSAQSVKLSDYINGNSPYKIKGMFALGLNHRIWGDSNNTIEALKKLDFLVVGDLFMTESAQVADIVLPVVSGLERDELKNFGNYLKYQSRIIEPLGEAKNDVEIILELSKYLGLDDKYLNMTYEEYINFVLEPTELNLKDLDNGEFVIPKTVKPYREKKYLSEELNTPSGKVEIYSSLLDKYSEEYGYDPLPIYRGYSDIYKEYKNLSAYPLILNTGSRKPHMHHTKMYRSSWIRNLDPVDSISLNPKTASKYGIENGDRIELSTFKGSIEGEAYLSIEALEDVVHMYHGNKNSDTNSLIDKDFLDPISGFPGYKSIPCRIRKIEGEYNG